MNITNAQYLKIEENNAAIKVTIDGQEMFVPLDPVNSHYAEILKQVADGTITIADAD